MALTDNGWWVTISFIDNGGNVSDRTYQMASTDYASAAQDAATLLGLVGDLSNAVIAGWALSNRFIQVPAAVPGSGVQVEDTALLNVRLNVGAKTATLSVPAPKSTIFMGTEEEKADIVDTSDPNVVAFVNAFRPSANGGFLYLSDGENVKTTGALISGRRVHRRSHRRRSLRMG